MIKKISKTDNTELHFLDDNNHWQSLTNKRTSDFLASKTLREKFGGLNIMKSVLSLDMKAATKLSRELPTNIEMGSIPLEELSSLDEDIHVKTREASQNTDLDMREFLGIDKALQGIKCEILNNTSKLTEINKRIQGQINKQLYRDRLDNLNTKEQARL